MLLLLLMLLFLWQLSFNASSCDSIKKLGLINFPVLSSPPYSFPSDCHFDFDAIERWLVMRCPIFEEVYLFALSASFGVEAHNKHPLVPTGGIDWEETR